jgi:hypothetical protein
VTASAVGARNRGTSAGTDGSGGELADERKLIMAGSIAACVVTGVGLAVITLIVLAGWIAAPHDRIGLAAVLRVAGALWLVAHHVGFNFRGAGRIGMLPLGLVVLPGLLLWRAGGWVVRAGQVRRLRHLGHAALALAVPYALASCALALATRSAVESSSVPEALTSGLLLAFVAGGLGGAHAIAPWPQLIGLLPERVRSVVVGAAGAFGALIAGGAVLAGAAMVAHLHQIESVEASLAPGAVGTLLLLLLQIAYLPNAIAWAIAFALGPGFAVGSATVVAPTGSALLQLPAFPMLASLPPGLHSAVPGWLEPTVLALPYLAGVIAGLLVVRAAPPLALDEAPLLGLVCGVASGGALAVLAAASGGPLGNGRLSAVGPSGWQVLVVAVLEIGVSAAVTAGVANYFMSPRSGRPSRLIDRSRLAASAVTSADSTASGHVIYCDPWGGESEKTHPPSSAGPASLP